MSDSPQLAAPGYRGLYAGVSEIARIGGFSRQYASSKLLRCAWFPEPLGYLIGERRPYWFLRDVLSALRGNRILAWIPEPSPGIEPWEYEYRGALVGVGGFAQLGSFVDGHAHTAARDIGLRYADRLLMGAVWREDEARAVLAQHGYPKERAA